jgi:hypothetical protein
MNMSLHPIPHREDEYFAAYLTDDPAREPVTIGWSIPRTIADAAVKLGRDRNEFSVERITPSNTGHLRSSCPLEHCATGLRHRSNGWH